LAIDMPLDEQARRVPDTRNAKAQFKQAQ